MSIEVKISKKKIPYKKAIFTLEKRVEDVKKGKKRISLDIRASNYLYKWYQIKRK